MKKQIFLFIISLMTFTSVHAQSEGDIYLDIFNYSNDLTSVYSNIVPLSIDAVWMASEIAGTETIIGTLTQDVNNYWTYTNSPSNKLVLKLPVPI